MDLLTNHELFHSDDVDFVRAEVAKVYCDHKLTPVKGNSLRARHHRAKIADVSLNYMQYGAEVDITPGELNDFFLIQLPLAGFAEINSGNQTVISDESAASIPAPDEHLSMRWSDDCEQLLVQISRNAIEKRLSSLIAQPLNAPLAFDLLMFSEDQKIKAWWRLIDYMLTEFQNDQPVTAGGGAEHMEQLIMTNLLYAQPHNYTDTLLSKSHSIAPAHVKKAEEYIRANIASHISIDDLVAVTGVSPRSLHEGFQKFRGQSPLNYLRSLRFENARKDLLTSNGDSVTAIASKWGFTQLGRFSVTYKEVYGESPSETMKRSKF